MPGVKLMEAGIGIVIVADFAPTALRPGVPNGPVGCVGPSELASVPPAAFDKEILKSSRNTGWGNVTVICVGGATVCPLPGMEETKPCWPTTIDGATASAKSSDDFSMASL